MDQNFTPENQPASPAPAPFPAQQPVAPVAPPSQSNGSGFAIAALVLGIIAFLFGWLGFLNLLTAILAVVFGIIALKKHQSKGMSIAGLVLGGIGLLTSLVFALIFIIALVQSSSESVNDSATTGSQSTDTSSKWDVEGVYAQLTEGMSKTDAEALVAKKAENCSESTSQYTGKVEYCTYGSYTDGASISITYTDEKLSNKSKYEY